MTFLPAVVTGRWFYLYLILDMYSRKVVGFEVHDSDDAGHAAHMVKRTALAEGLHAMAAKPVLHGDNGATLQATTVLAMLHWLSIKPLYSRPRVSDNKGKQERWFRTVRAQLLPTLTEADTASLEALNRQLWAWVEGEYRHSPHQGLDGLTPLERWAGSEQPLRLLDPQLDLDELFLFEARRRVQRDHTVSLDGRLFELDAALVGQTVTLRYDPATAAARGIDVWHDGRFVERARTRPAPRRCGMRLSARLDGAWSAWARAGHSPPLSC